MINDHFMANIPLNYHDRRTIEEMYKSGYTISDIARYLKKSRSCIKNEMNRSGGKEKYSADLAQKLYIRRQEIRYASYRYQFSEDEMKIIEKGINDGFSIYKLSKMLNRDFITIKNYLRSMNLQSVHQKYSSIEERLSNLEAQIEIILDFINPKDEND